jgi:predicted  nucleic acid-binding Zn-ribbon protein
MADELWNTLMRFHREVALPDIRAAIAVPLREEMAAFRRETNGHFDAIHKRLERLESEYQELAAAVRRVEDRLAALEQRVGAVEQTLDRMALRSELLELKAQVANLEERIAQLEGEI